jgi:hypothetical protein
MSDSFPLVSKIRLVSRSSCSAAVVEFSFDVCLGEREPFLDLLAGETDGDRPGS